MEPRIILEAESIRVKQQQGFLEIEFNGESELEKYRVSTGSVCAEEDRRSQWRSILSGTVEIVVGVLGLVKIFEE